MRSKTMLAAMLALAASSPSSASAAGPMTLNVRADLPDFPREPRMDRAERLRVPSHIPARRFRGSKKPHRGTSRRANRAAAKRVQRRKAGAK